jgi:hypothetical protein
MKEKEYSAKFTFLVRGEDTSEQKASEVLNALYTLSETLEADELIGITQFVVENPDFLGKLRNMIEKSKKTNQMPSINELMSFINELQKVVV